MLATPYDDSGPFAAGREGFRRRPTIGHMSNLATRKCQSCGPDTPPLEPAEVQELLGDVPLWSLKASSLVRELKFKNFRDAFGMGTRVALLAEEEGHHPDFEIGWGKLKLTLTTHAAKGLTANDFIMAAKIDVLTG